MNTRHASRWFWLMLLAIFLSVPFFADTAITQSPASANVKTADGLTVVTFVVNPGKIMVNLPDDLRAGDTISGTVLCEPKGNTKEERGANQSELNKLGIKLIGRPEEKPEEVSCGDVSVPLKGILFQDDTRAPLSLVVALFVKLGNTLAQASIPVPTHPSGAVITPDPKITQPTHPSGAVITPDPKITNPPFSFPHLGQTGRPIVVTGPFDGNSSNTALRVGDWEDRDNMGRFDLIAESPRKAVFTAPTNVTGPIELHLTEGNTRSTGSYRNVGVNLSAPKTNLLKGEQTTLTVQVTGLEGIKQPVPLTLECKGVITMDGGIYQPLVIQPSQVGADGRYTTTRGITGVQAGGWTATATVVTGPFNVCLQDDSRPATVILWNTVTGDYRFSPPAGSAATQTGSAPPAGKGTMAMKGCILTLQHNAPDRRVFATLDTCTQTGSASVQTSPPNSPKVKFTITDKNTTDNTCPCPAGENCFDV